MPFIAVTLNASDYQPNGLLSSCLGAAVVEHWTRDRKVASSSPGRDAIKLTRSTQPSIPPMYSTSLRGWGLVRCIHLCRVAVSLC